MRRAGAWGRLLAAVSILAIAALTLYPIPHAARAASLTPLLCLLCGELGGVDVVLNVILFLPLGLGLRLTGAPIRRAVLAAALLSFTVELLQYTVVPGRDASLSDVLTNTLGGAVGALIADRLPLLLFPSPRAAGRLLAGGVLLWLGLLAVAGWLLSPDFGGGEIGSAAASAPAPEVFGGRVLEVRRDGVLQPRGGTPPDSAALRADLRRGRIDLVARIVSGPPLRGRRWIYVIGENGSPRLDLSQERRNALLGVPARSQRYSLSLPSIMLPLAFPADTGRAVTLHATEHHRRLRITSEYDGITRTVSLTLSPATAWTLLAPFSLGVGPAVPFVTVLVVLFLSLPLGYWAGRMARFRAAAAAIGAALVLGLGVLPALEGFPPVHWSEWIGAVAGAAAGWAVSPAAAYLQRRCGSPSTAESFSS